MVRLTWQQASEQDASLRSLAAVWPVDIERSLLQVGVKPQGQQPQFAQPLQGGLTNHCDHHPCWKITLQTGRHLVWRPVSISSSALGVSRGQEAKTLQLLKPYDFAPNLEYLSDDGILVDWMAGISLHSHSEASLEALTGQSAQSLVLEALTQLHQIKLEEKHFQQLTCFDFERHIDFYWQQLDDSVKCPQLNHLYQYYRQSPPRSVNESCLCHFDIGSYNLIWREGGGLGVIDWEYAAIASPALDLAISIQSEQLDEELSVRAYCHRRGIAEITPWLEEVQAWQPRVGLMSLLWFYLAYQLVKQPEYLKQAQQIHARLSRDFSI